MPTAVEINIDKALKAFATLDTSYKKVNTDARKHMNEYETINSALWEGLDEIKGVEGKIKTEKDEKKKATLEKELKGYEDTVKKMTEKLKSIVNSLKADGTVVGQLSNSGTVVKNTVATLNNEAKRAALEDVKQAQEDLKKLAEISKLLEKIGTLKNEITSLPKPAVKL